MTIELHTWNTPNGRKISVALEEMGLPYKVIPINISKNEQFAPGIPRHQPEQQGPRDRRPRWPRRQARQARRVGGDFLAPPWREDRQVPARPADRADPGALNG